MFSLDGTSFLIGVMCVDGISVLLFSPNVNYGNRNKCIVCILLSLADLNKLFVHMFKKAKQVTVYCNTTTKQVTFLALHENETS